MVQWRGVASANRRHCSSSWRDQMAPYLDRMNTFSGEGEVFSGITAMPRPGHTPVHTTYLIASGDDQLLI